MAGDTTIEWTDATWNPVTGCTKVSAGCDHCYAETFYERFNGPGSFATVLTHPRRLEVPLRWRKPRKVFVNSMSDLFHADVPTEFIAEVWAVMALTPHHTYQILTKRHGRMRSLLSDDRFTSLVTAALNARGAVPFDHFPYPLPNVWIGVSAEDQKTADLRIPALMATPAAVRWVSAEPLLGPIDLTRHMRGVDGEYGSCGGRSLDWVVVGGESGPGARPMDPAWVRSIRDRCARDGVSFLFKQWGRHDAEGRSVGKRRAGRELDGVTHDGYPEAAA